MKEVFDKYFEKLNEVYDTEFKTKPSVPFMEDIDSKLIVSQPDEEDYVEWQPVEFKKELDWKVLEDEIGFELSNELKEYYSTYLFCDLKGYIDKMYFNFYPIYNDNIFGYVRQHFADGQWIFENSQIFLIGDACVQDNDAYFIYYDNKNKNLFLYFSEDDQNNRIDLGTLSQVISDMKASI